MPVGQPLKIKKSLFEMVKRFDKRRFDVILFHYDPDDNIGNWEELNKHATLMQEHAKRQAGSVHSDEHVRVLHDI